MFPDPVLSVYILAMRMPRSGPSCVVCEYAMGYLHEELESASVKKDIEALVENLCSHLPSAFKNEVCIRREWLLL